MRSIIGLYRNAFLNIQPKVWILAIAMFINRSGSMVLLFTSLYLTNELHFTIADAGIALSFYGIGSVLGSYVGGWLADRRNFLDVMLLALISSGSILLGLLIVNSFWGVSFVILAYAFAADMFRPANAKAIATYSTAENRTRSFSIVRLAINLGFSIGPAAGGFIAMFIGYKWLFVIDSCSSFATAIMLFIYLPKKKSLVKTKSNVFVNDSKSAYRDWPYLTFILLAAFYGIMFFQLFSSVPQYFSKVCNYSEGTIGLLLALNGIFVVVLEMPLIGFLEKKNKPFKFIIIGTLLLAVAFTVLQLGSGMMHAVLFILIVTFSEIFAMPFMMNYSISRPTINRQGQYAALYSISFGLSNTIAPIVGLGIAAAYGFGNMFYSLILLGLLTTAGFIILNKRNKKI